MAGSGPSMRELIGLGASVAGSVVLGVVLGFSLDKAFGSAPALLFAGLAAGTAAAIAAAALQVRRFADGGASAEAQSGETLNSKEALR